jgi:hypothetical protein
MAAAATPKRRQRLLGEQSVIARKQYHRWDGASIVLPPAIDSRGRVDDPLSRCNAKAGIPSLLFHSSGPGLRAGYSFWVAQINELRFLVASCPHMRYKSLDEI